MPDEYDAVVRRFRWDIPEFYNLGVAVSDRQVARGCGTALVVVDENWSKHIYSFEYLSIFSNKLANCLVKDGWRRGDRIAVLLPPSVHAAIAHVAIFKSGLISVPLQLKDKPDAILDRLRLSEAGAIITVGELAEDYGDRWQELPHVGKIYVVAESSLTVGCEFLEDILSRSSASFLAPVTRPGEPAILAFTSGTEGRSKGVLHAHRVALSGLPAMLFSGMPAEHDLIWSHFDWGWLGGLLVPLIGWHCGAAVLLHHQTILNPLVVDDLLRDFEVTRVSIAPTALKMLQQTIAPARYPLLQSMTSGGEKLDETTQDWARDQFGVVLSEIYGLSECGAVLGSGNILQVRRGSVGKPAPGQTVRVVDDEGAALGPGELGKFAIKTPHPQMFLGYWRDEEATRDRFIGSFFNTGDLGFTDDEGYFWYAARGAEIINSAGHRIGPSEVEQAFLSNGAVKLCAAVGVPDALSGESIVLWVELNDGWDPSFQTEKEILRASKSKLAPYQVPKRIRFVQGIPTTTSGKVNRVAVRGLEMGLMPNDGVGNREDAT